MTITACVVFAGTSFQPALAQAEAIRQFEAAVELVGGVVDLHAVTSQVGRWTVPDGYRQPAGPRGRG